MKRILMIAALVAAVSITASAQYGQIGAGGGYAVGNKQAPLFYLAGNVHVTQWQSRFPVLVLGEVDFLHTRPNHHDTQADLLGRLYLHPPKDGDLEVGKASYLKVDSGW